jgi:hypothetical protein
VQPCDEDDNFFPSNGARVEQNWQGKTEVLGEKPVLLPLCPPQISHGLTWDRTRASAVRGRRLTAWAMTLPSLDLTKPTNAFLNFAPDYPPEKRNLAASCFVTSVHACCPGTEQWSFAWVFRKGVVICQPLTAGE